MSQPEPDPVHSELVTYAGRLVRAVSRRAHHRLPAATLRMLAQVEELGPVTIGHLAEADRCTQPTMSSAVQNLVAKGWATKQPNPDDARSSLVALTDDGRQLLATARAENARVVADRLAGVPDADTDDLRAAVTLLKSLLEAPRTDPEGTA